MGYLDVYQFPKNQKGNNSTLKSLDTASKSYAFVHMPIYLDTFRNLHLTDDESSIRLISNIY